MKSDLIVGRVLLFGRHALCAFHRVEGQCYYWHIPTDKTRLDSFLFAHGISQTDEDFVELSTYRSFDGNLNTVLSCWSTTTCLVLIVLLHTSRIG